MKLFLARLTAQFWQLVCSQMQNSEADVTFLDTIKFLVQIAIPQAQTIPNTAILKQEVLKRCLF